MNRKTNLTKQKMIRKSIVMILLCAVFAGCSNKELEQKIAEQQKIIQLQEKMLLIADSVNNMSVEQFEWTKSGFETLTEPLFADVLARVVRFSTPIYFANFKKETDSMGVIKDALIKKYDGLKKELDELKPKEVQQQ